MKYLLCPGEVRSKNDGDYHYIGARDLARLYGVPFDECAVLPSPERGALGGGRARTAMLAAANRGEYVCLWPRSNGDYTLPDNYTEEKS